MPRLRLNLSLAEVSGAKRCNRWGGEQPEEQQEPTLMELLEATKEYIKRNRPKVRKGKKNAT